MTEHVLDNAAWWALATLQNDVAVDGGRARRYRTDLSPFAAVEHVDEEHLADLAALLRATGPGSLFRADLPEFGDDWAVHFTGAAEQMVLGDGALTEGSTEGLDARRLGLDDAPAMQALVARTEPGPFCERTVELGDYWGVWDDGVLVAMAGERMHLPGWREISAVCTAPEARGRGLASALTRRVAEGIVARGEQPFLHVAVGNEGAKRIYESLGFLVRRRIGYALVEPKPV